MIFAKAVNKLSVAHPASEEELVEFVEQIAPKLFRFAWATIRDYSLAEDIVQECLARYVVYRDKHHGKSPPLRWFFTVVAHLCMDVFRQKRQEVQLFDQLSLAKSSYAEIPDDNQELSVLWDAIAQLKPKDRMAIVLVYYHDLPLKEAAAILGTTPTFLKTKLARLRKRLRNEVAEHDEKI
ncbi:RNA polymerase sigma factor [Sulfobacillus thermosulfidooxidans]|uniref:RNA polymerase sigma factor n=1 Tax=Sulfobacillus thermosulfidooxidans TaxID=28034 RepID=UPI0002E3B26B|nr:RNA polymerase sigma factor [Sulfobacillus thermosulfidooxidans]